MSIHQTITATLWKKAVIYSTAACISLCSAVAVHAQKADFSGSWKLNEPKSTLGQYTRMTPRTLKVNSQKDSLVIQRYSTSQDGTETNYTETLTFNGNPSESTISANAKKKSTAKWSDDGQTLTINATIAFDRDGQSFEVQVVETWKLTEGGKVLTVASASTSQMGTNTTRLLFDKAS